MWKAVKLGKMGYCYRYCYCCAEGKVAVAVKAWRWKGKGEVEDGMNGDEWWDNSFGIL